MASISRSGRRAIAVAAAVTVIATFALWHQRSNLPEHPLSYIKDTLPFKSSRLSFAQIARKHGTDKVTQHHYERMYEHTLASLRDKPVKMLEIGLGCDMSYGPGASYYTWLEYFTDVDLYYIEYDFECAKLWENKTSKATVFAGDQADTDFLTTFLNEAGGGFDVIVDDGGHTMLQQKTSLHFLWPSVKPGGIYFVEDLATSYMQNYGGQPGGSDDSFMAEVKGMLDDINKFGAQNTGRTPMGNQVARLEFTQEVVALYKGEGEEFL